VSKLDEIKNKKRQQTVSPSRAISQEVDTTEKEDKNVVRNKEIKIQRKRVSFDLRTDLHKQLKVQSVMQDKNIYVLIEEALDKYLNE
jgi:hypothetical protein